MSPNDPFASLLGGKRCLIVEDEFLIALDYERILQGAGAQAVLSANSLRRAEDLLQQHGPVQLILLDVNLGGQSSLPFARKIIEQGVPLVIITGMSGHAALPSEFSSIPVLEKPFEESTLLTRIAAVLSQK